MQAQQHDAKQGSQFWLSSTRTSLPGSVCSNLWISSWFWQASTYQALSKTQVQKLLWGIACIIRPLNGGHLKFSSPKSAASKLALWSRYHIQRNHLHYWQSWSFQEGQLPKAIKVCNVQDRLYQSCESNLNDTTYFEFWSSCQSWGLVSLVQGVQKGSSVECKRRLPQTELIELHSSWTWQARERK